MEIRLNHCVCHTMNMNLRLLDEEFDGRVVSRRAIRGQEWPPRSPDLNPCDFFLWGYLKWGCFFLIKCFPWHIWDTHSTLFWEGVKNFFLWNQSAKGIFPKSPNLFAAKHSTKWGEGTHLLQKTKSIKNWPKNRVMVWNMTHAAKGFWFPSPNQIHKLFSAKIYSPNREIPKIPFLTPCLNNCTLHQVEGLHSPSRQPGCPGSKLAGRNCHFGPQHAHKSPRGHEH